MTISSTRQAPGITIEVIATLNAGLVANFELSWRTAAGLSMQAEYALHGPTLHTMRRQDENPAEHTEMTLEGDGPFLLSPLMRIYTGPVISRLLEYGGQGTVIVPAIGDPDDVNALLRPHFSQRQARVLESRIELITGDTTVYCKLCEYTGDQYATGSQFWLGLDEVLLRYQWRQSPDLLWRVSLCS